MFGYKMNDYDIKVYNEEIKDCLPDRIIDVHTHVYKKEFNIDNPQNENLVKWTGMVADECPIEDLVQTYIDLLPGKKVIPVIMSNPSLDLKLGNEYILQCIKKYNYKAFYCTKYDTAAEEIEDTLLNKGFCGIKPYLNNAPAYIPGDEIRIFDFLPHEHLTAVNKLKGIVMLHIPRSGRLKDPVNIAQLMEIEEKYPDLKLIVAHIGRAYAPEDIGNAFEILKNTKNMMFDFSANTLAEAMEQCIIAVGPKRIMFGTDMPIAKMRMRRITKDGKYYNIVPKGLYGDVSDDWHMIETENEQLTNFTYEQLRAFIKAANNTGLTKNNINDIFFGNAARILDLEVQK